MSQGANYYELLELDPSVSDWPTIEAQLEAKRREWSSQRNAPKMATARRAQAGLAAFGDMHRELHDPEKRLQHQLAARAAIEARRQRRGRDLKNAIDIYLAGSGRIGIRAFGELTREFSDSFSEGELRQQLSAVGLTIGDAPKSSIPPFVPPPQLPAPKWKEIRECMRIVGHDTLYEFLGLDRTTSLSARVERARAIGSELTRSGKTDPKSSTAATLAGHCAVIFQSESETAQYDGSESSRVFEELRAQLRRAGHDGVVTERELHVLVDFAKSRGIRPQVAMSFIAQESASLNLHVQYADTAASVETASCGRCGAINLSSASSCSACGSPLSIACPECAAPTRSDAASCDKCGCRVGDASYVDVLQSAGEEALARGALATAEDAWRRASAIWPRARRLADLHSRIQARKSERDALRQELDAAVASMRVYEAGRLLDRITEAFPDAVGGSTQSEIRTAVQRADALFAAAETAKRAGHETQTLLALERCVAEATDHSGARALLAGMPPAAPSAVRVVLRPHGFGISWEASPSPGSVTYRVVRRVGATPSNVDDGACVATIAGTSVHDPDAPAGYPCHYAVWAVRCNVPSAVPAVAAPALAASAPHDVRAVGGDGSVTISWRRPDGAVDVRVEAGASDGGRRVLRATGDTVVDSGLPNGVLQSYRLVAYYPNPAVRGSAVASEAVTVQIRPEPLPPAVTDLRAHRRDSRVDLTWTHPERGSVRILRTTDTPAFSLGDVISLDEAVQGGQLVPVSGRDTTQDTIALGAGRVVYTALSVHESTCAVGSSVAVSRVDPATGVEVRTGPRSIHVVWKWPQNVGTCFVLASEHAAKLPTDGSVARKRVDRSHYDRDGGVTLSVPERRPYHVSVFAMSMDGQASDPVTELVTMGATADVRYVVEAKRDLLRRNLKSARIVLTSPISGIDLSNLVLVGKRGAVPVTARDGVVLLRAGAVQLTKGRAELVVPEEHLNRGYIVKLFFEDTACAGAVRLIPGSMSQLEV